MVHCFTSALSLHTEAGDERSQSGGGKVLKSIGMSSGIMLGCANLYGCLWILQEPFYHVCNMAEWVQVVIGVLELMTS